MKIGKILGAPVRLVGRAVPRSLKEWVAWRIAGIAAKKAGGVLKKRVEEEAMPTSTAKWKSTTFLLTVAAQVITYVYAAGIIVHGTLIDQLLALAASALVTAGYSVSRGESKTGTPAGNKPGWQTSEFWLSVIQTVAGLAVTAGAFAADSLPAKLIGILVSVLPTLAHQKARATMAAGHTAAITIETFGTVQQGDGP